MQFSKKYIYNLLYYLFKITIFRPKLLYIYLKLLLYLIIMCVYLFIVYYIFVFIILNIYLWNLRFNLLSNIGVYYILQRYLILKC